MPATPNLATGGFTPSLKTIALGLSGPYEASFLASQHGMLKRSGITVAQANVGVDANGDRILKAGTVMGKITASGLYRAYAAANGDGSQTPVGFLMETINLRDGNVVVGLLVHGSVLSARVSAVDAGWTALSRQFVIQ